MWREGGKDGVKVVEWKEEGSNGGGMEGRKDEGGRQASSFSHEDSMSIRCLRFKLATIGTEEEVPLNKKINKLNLAYKNRITKVYTLKWLDLKLI